MKKGPSFVKDKDIGSWPKVIESLKTIQWRAGCMVWNESIHDPYSRIGHNTINLVMWYRFLNKFEPWHIVYILQQ